VAQGTVGGVSAPLPYAPGLRHGTRQSMAQTSRKAIRSALPYLADRYIHRCPLVRDGITSARLLTALDLPSWYPATGLGYATRTENPQWAGMWLEDGPAMAWPSLLAPCSASISFGTSSRGKGHTVGARHGDAGRAGPQPEVDAVALVD
jgi:hypothetical protein